MAKNNKLINSLNEIARRNRSQNVATAADQMVPQIYAAIAIALHRTYGFGYKRINDVFVESQHIWESYAGDGAGMVKKCEEETGVTVCSPEEAQRLMEMQNGMLILMGQRIGYVPTRKVIAMERSHPGMITALTTNQKTYNNELNYIIKF